MAEIDEVSDSGFNGKVAQKATKVKNDSLLRNQRVGRLAMTALWRNPTSDMLPTLRNPCKIVKKKPPLIQKFFRGLIFGPEADKVQCNYIESDVDEQEDPDEKFNRLYNGPRQGVRLYERSRTITSKKSLIPLNDRRKNSNSKKKREEEEGKDQVILHRSVLSRRYSHDELISYNREYLIDVPTTLETLVSQEDTDGDFRITVLDKGPKCFLLGSASSNGYNKYEIRGTYNISNLLQELALASELKHHAIILSQERLDENPLVRLDRVIREVFWENLTRCMDYDGIGVISQDQKFPGSPSIIYLPHFDKLGLEYYSQLSSSLSNMKLQVIQLPKKITPEFVRDLNQYPGILSLKIKSTLDPNTNQIVNKPCKYIVPGGRFNELYGWDSYFITLGLIEDGFIGEACDIVDNMCYEIEYYGKILNANRSYYLCRSQPPLFTDMINKTVTALLADNDNIQDALSIIYRGYRAVLKELFSVWLSKPRYVPLTGLSRYYSEGIGIPPETEPTHFLHLLKPHAEKHGIDFSEFVRKYTIGEFKDSELDEYFTHDRAVRESGHDTTYRFENRCSNLNTIDLNSLLYKYEIDITRFISNDPRGYITINVRRGENDEFLKSFMKFSTDLENHPFCKLLTEYGGLETHWANGIIVDDDKLDKYNMDQINFVLSNYDENCQNKGDPSSSSESIAQELKKILSFNNNDYCDISSPSDIITPRWKVKSYDGKYDETFEVYFYPTLFDKLSEFTKTQVNKYLWNEEKSLFFDYDIKIGKQIEYETVTTLWSLWSGLASKQQAERMVPIALKKFEVTGGLVSGTMEGCCKDLKMDKPSRQWDYPYGWAPHQVMAWMGLSEYGYVNDAKRLAYRWVYVITKSFFDFNGVVPEKYDVVNMTHMVNVEYGNVGSDFTYVVKEGFGWMNASFKIGLNYLSKHMRLCIGVLTHPDEYFYKKPVTPTPFTSKIG